MELGPDSKLSETQTPEFVGAGALRPWTTGDLPPAPEGGLAYWKKAVGPGLLLAGASIGAGEWLFGPAVTAQYGAALLWLAFLSIAGQLFAGGSSRSGRVVWSGSQGYCQVKQFGGILAARRHR